MKTDRTQAGLVTQSDFIGQNGHQGYKHEEADSDEANTRGRPHLTANMLPVPDFPHSIFESKQCDNVDFSASEKSNLNHVLAYQDDGQTSKLSGMFPPCFNFTLTLNAGKTNSGGVGGEQQGKEMIHSPESTKTAGLLSIPSLS